MVMRLAGNKEGKGKGGKGNGDEDEGVRRQRGQGWQSDGDGNKGGRGVDGDRDKEGDGGDDKIRGHWGQQLPTFAHHTTMIQDHGQNGNNNDDWHCWTQQSTASML